MSADQTPLKRKPNWAAELTKFLVELQALSRKGQLSFDWDNSNCAWFVGTAINRMTDAELYTPFEGVTSRHEAAKSLLDLGFRSLEQYTDTLAPVISLVEAKRGDVGLAEGVSDEGLVLALLEPPFFWVIGPEGLIKLPLYPSTNGGNVGIVKAYKIG